jgi:hypothetical protein
MVQTNVYGSLSVEGVFRPVSLEYFRVWEVWPTAGTMQKILIRLPNQNLCDRIEGTWNVTISYDPFGPFTIFRRSSTGSKTQ